MKSVINTASLLAALFLVGCGSEQWSSIEAQNDGAKTAQLLLTNGRIYTMNPDQPWADAIAVSDGRIVAVGSSGDLAAYAGADTERIDLGGKLVLPGINDGHSHPVWGGVKSLFQCNFPFSATPQDIQDAITTCVADQPDALWIQGGQWTSNFFVDNDVPSPRKLLDAVSGDKAVLLRDDSGHNIWANSKALKLMGIDKDTPDPKGGYYPRDPETGEPNGLMIEAFAVARNVVPDWSQEQYNAAAMEAVTRANEFGITGMKDASAEANEVAAYYALEQAGELSVHVATSLYAPAEDGSNKLDIEMFKFLREQFGTERINTSCVKIFLDGVPTASRTAAMLEPYTPENPGDEPVYGDLHVEAERLSQVVTELDKLGFTIKIHTAGDRAVRVALDAIEAARIANGDSGLRHELSHTEYIDPADLPRFASLNVVAGFTPYIWWPSPITDSIMEAVPAPRNAQVWPTRDLLDSGALLLAGSDWPSAVPDMNPWPGMEALISRADPFGIYPGTLWEEQKITLEEALKIYTLNGAKALDIEQKTGSIEVGKSADLIVLHQNLFDIPVEDISETRIDQTWFEGQLVFSSRGRQLWSE